MYARTGLSTLYSILRFAVGAQYPRVRDVLFEATKVDLVK